MPVSGTGTGSNAIFFEFYCLGEGNGKHPKRKDKSNGRERVDSLLHAAIGSAMKYFHQSEWDIKWKMTWENYILYISSIPRFDSDGNKETEIKSMEIADWS